MHSKDLMELCDYNAEVLPRPDKVNKNYATAALQLERLNGKDMEEYDLSMLLKEYNRCIEKHGHFKVWEVLND